MTVSDDELIARLEEWVKDREPHPMEMDEGNTQTLRLAAARLRSLSESKREMAKAVNAMLDAIKNGGIDSQEIDGDHENGVPPHKWHEEWAFHAERAVIAKEAGHAE